MLDLLKGNLCGEAAGTCGCQVRHCNWSLFLTRLLLMLLKWLSPGLVGWDGIDDARSRLGSNGRRRCSWASRDTMEPDLVLFHAVASYTFRSRLLCHILHLFNGNEGLVGCMGRSPLLLAHRQSWINVFDESPPMPKEKYSFSTRGER